jgi:hypothetical protein
MLIGDFNSCDNLLTTCGGGKSKLPPDKDMRFIVILDFALRKWMSLRNKPPDSPKHGIRENPAMPFVLPKFSVDVFGEFDGEDFTVAPNLRIGKIVSNDPDRDAFGHAGK